VMADDLEHALFEYAPLLSFRLYGLAASFIPRQARSCLRVFLLYLLCSAPFLNCLRGAPFQNLDIYLAKRFPFRPNG
jgi:hypothetical protein